MLRLVNFHPAVVPDYALPDVLFLCVVDRPPVLSKWTVVAEGKEADVALEVFVVDDSVMHTYLSHLQLLTMFMSVLVSTNLGSLIVMEALYSARTTLVMT